MTVADVVQTVSLVAVAFTVMLTALQNRNVAAQTREAVKQSALANAAMMQSSHQSLISHASDSLTFLITQEPELLSWFLRSRGVPTGSVEHNKRLMFVFARMDIHESNYVNYLDRGLPEDVWHGWRRVVDSDAATPEFALVWPVVKDSYSARFVSFIDGVLAGHPMAG